jgi:FecR-like protein
MLRGWVGRRTVIGLCILSQTFSIYAWSGTSSLGTTRGSRAVEVSLDDGKSWLALGGRSYAVMPETLIRSRSGSALVELVDGSRVTILPFSAVRFHEAAGSMEVVLQHGRLTFQLPADTQLDISTPAARLAPERQTAMAGELFAKGEGEVGLKMTKGTMHVHPFTDPTEVMLASADPVFLPQRPVGQGPLFTSETIKTPPSGAKGAFTPTGESIGYLQPDGQFVVQPGFTADLTQPFPPNLVRVAMATIPEATASDATPLFDVNGGYLGYLDDASFYPQMRMAQAIGGGSASGAAGGGMSTSGFVALGSIFGVGGGLMGLGFSGAFSQDNPGSATPIQPIR